MKKLLLLLLVCVSMTACSKDGDSTIYISKNDLIGNWFCSGSHIRQDFIFENFDCTVGSNFAGILFNNGSNTIDLTYDLQGNNIILSNGFTIKIKSYDRSTSTLSLECNGHAFKITKGTIISDCLIWEEWVEITADSKEELIYKINNFPTVSPNYHGLGYDIPLLYRKLRVSGALTEYPAWTEYSNSNFSIKLFDLSNTSIKVFSVRSFLSATEVILPNSAEDINMAFADCSYLTTMNLPANVKSITDCSFKDLYSLTEVNIRASIPPTINYLQDLVDAQYGHLYPKIYPQPFWILNVPVGSKTAYTQHEWWGRFQIINEK